MNGRVKTIVFWLTVIVTVLTTIIESLRTLTH